MDPTHHDKAIYEVVEADGRYEVRAPSGRCVMICADEASAGQYAVTLNEAYRAGYKQALRDGR